MRRTWKAHSWCTGSAIGLHGTWKTRELPLRPLRPSAGSCPNGLNFLWLLGRWGQATGLLLGPTDSPPVHATWLRNTALPSASARIACCGRAAILRGYRFGQRVPAIGRDEVSCRRLPNGATFGISPDSLRPCQAWPRAGGMQRSWLVVCEFSREEILAQLPKKHTSKSARNASPLELRETGTLMPTSSSGMTRPAVPLSE